jgi:hypothetical protein
VVIEGDGQFPDFLVGRWKANSHNWEFVFEPDGTISSAVISLGRAPMKPGETTSGTLQGGGKGFFEPGQWLVHYSPESRALTVEVTLKRFYTEWGTGPGKGILEGKARDVLVGEIAEDGELWQADWNSFPEYIVTTNIYKDHKLVSDPNKSFQGRLIFEKVVPE